MECPDEDLTCPECGHCGLEDEFNPDQMDFMTFYDCPVCDHNFDWGERG